MPLQITIEDLAFNEESDCFETSLKLNGKSHSLTICDFERKENKQASALAVKLKNWLEENLDNTKEFTASKLLKLKNENWLSENEEPISKKKFIETIEFRGVNAFAKGGFEIYFTDHGLFGGHTIIVDINEAFEFENANLAG